MPGWSQSWYAAEDDFELQVLRLYLMNSGIQGMCRHAAIDAALRIYPSAQHTLNKYSTNWSTSLPYFFKVTNIKSFLHTSYFKYNVQLFVLTICIHFICMVEIAHIHELPNIQ